MCFSPLSLSLSLQLVLRALLSPPRGQDYVSNARSTVAPLSRPPPSVVVGTAITVGTWTNLRTFAPVSLSLSLSVKRTHTYMNKNTYLRNRVAECDYASR